MNDLSMSAVWILQFFSFGVDFRFGVCERGKLSLQQWKNKEEYIWLKIIIKIIIEIIDLHHFF